MSARNSQANKAAARERLRQERERQAKRDKVRRQLIVAGSTVAVLALAGGIGYAVVQATKPGAWEAAKDKELVKPANSEGDKGTTIKIGSGKSVVDVYEDLRCPACAAFEQSTGETIKKAAGDDKITLKVHLGDIIDGNLGGSGSKNAISALGAALNVSTDAFLEYHSQLYSAKHHPAETADEFAEDSYLLDVAKDVDALKDNASFKDAVEKGTYDKWALEMIDDFKNSEIRGTPTIRIDGKDVDQRALPAELKKLGVG
ncbi:thioredoxin domain-containing protein [Streptomyces sp. HNM0663]|uniref:Thioredoxin domain-containing protein n=1 Tax=Streptomyces chengmaiensis TaxID=3040919 RepID=A0ABT6HMH2_9ACTN|nr:thioredoxin domain-containing protein [Streptomyces chengmaiensis]MDH2389921.1 thioredoxin domain-containing protein [Streptomyces chengmaiensis]